jgi:hypothetical protein
MLTSITGPVLIETPSILLQMETTDGFGFGDISDRIISGFKAQMIFVFSCPGFL